MRHEREAARPKGKVGVVLGAAVLVVVAALVPARLAAAVEGGKLDGQITSVAGADRSAQGRARDAPRSTSRPPSDLYRLTKALPDDDRHVGDHARPQPARAAAQARSSCRSQPGCDGRSERVQRRSRSTWSCRVASATSRSSSVTSARSCACRSGSSTPAAGSIRCRRVSITTPDEPEVPGRQGDGEARRLHVQRPGADDARTRPRLPHVLEWDGRSRSDPLMATKDRHRRRQGEEAEDDSHRRRLCSSRAPCSRARS